MQVIKISRDCGDVAGFPRGSSGWRGLVGGSGAAKVGFRKVPGGWIHQRLVSRAWVEELDETLEGGHRSVPDPWQWFVDSFQVELCVFTSQAPEVLCLGQDHPALKFWKAHPTSLSVSGRHARGMAFGEKQGRKAPMNCNVESVICHRPFGTVETFFGRNLERRCAKGLAPSRRNVLAHDGVASSRKTESFALNLKGHHHLPDLCAVQYLAQDRSFILVVTAIDKTS